MMIYLSNFLSKNNDVTFYTFKFDSELFSDLTFKVQDFKKSKLISFFKIVYELRKYDYVFIWNSPMHFAAVFSKIFFNSKAKLIWWHHHYPWYYSSNANVYIKFKSFLEKLLIKEIDLFISNSKYLQDVLKDIYKRDSKILYPVLGDKFLNHNRKEFLSNTSNIIFTYGRWVEGKNLKLVFKVYDDLKNKIPNLVLKIWWTWNQIQKYKDKFIKDKNIHLLWDLNTNQIINNLEQSNIFLFSSLIDSFWLVIIESMSIWVPVISFNKSWAKEIIENWVNWFLVDSDKEFIEKTYEVLNNTSLRNNLSNNSLNTLEKFWEKSFKKSLEEIFNTL